MNVATHTIRFYPVFYISQFSLLFIIIYVPIYHAFSLSLLLIIIYVPIYHAFSLSLLFIIIYVPIYHAFSIIFSARLFVLSLVSSLHHSSCSTLHLIASLSHILLSF